MYNSPPLPLRCAGAAPRDYLIPDQPPSPQLIALRLGPELGHSGCNYRLSRRRTARDWRAREPERQIFSSAGLQSTLFHRVQACAQFSMNIINNRFGINVRNVRSGSKQNSNFLALLSEVGLWTQLRYMKYWPIPNLRFYSLSISYCNEVST